jgi:diaminobutyrate-2-oxoglutarate transaminase
MHQTLFDENESNVRYYCRKLPNLLVSASGSVVVDSEGRRFTDFMSSCGTLNYGHNHPDLKVAAIEHLLADGISAALDFHTGAKFRFIDSFRRRVLLPRGLDYRLQFTGPTGANCVEAAIKLARKATGRMTIVAFTNAFHGVSMGALSATGSATARKSVAPLLSGVIRLPFEGYCGAGVADLLQFEAMASDPSGGIEPVAAFIVETVQGEGGLNAASSDWLSKLAGVARRLGALLIVDDIQAGCGRTGGFFSFERAGIVPDMVCLAKSIGGYGFPMSLLLMDPAIDVWVPGEHNGTFRGNTIAFATAAAALDLWTPEFEAGIGERSALLEKWCGAMERLWPGEVRRKGIGMMRGLEFLDPAAAAEVAAAAIRAGVIIECCGPRDEVLKVLAPLNIDLDLFANGLNVLTDAISGALARPDAIAVLEGNEAFLDPYDHGRNSVVGAELPHGVA